MARDAYVNGRYVPHSRAMVHVEDRGFQFADGVYEVVTVRGGRLLDERGHLDRLARSLGELRMAWPCRREVLALIIRELVRRNGLHDGIVYLQVTRGAAPRDFRFPAGAAPSLVITTRRLNRAPAHADTGVSVITIPDIRWKRRDIKSVSLLPQVLGKQQAAEEGAFEAWQVDEEGRITEGCSSNAWIVSADSVLLTRRAGPEILNGVTRQTILRLAEGRDIGFEERPFAVAEAHEAREAFLSSATTFVMPVVRIDGRPVGDGRPGPLSRALRALYLDYAEGEGATI